ncbi:NADH-quinone oxidoreductase subunit J [soil metagenome]
MTLTNALFLILAAVTVVSALGVAFSRSVIHSAVWLLMTLVTVALLYLLLGAEFLSATQLIVYVGGIMVLIVFGVMLTSGGPFATISVTPVQRIGGGAVALTLIGLCVLAVSTVPATPTPEPAALPNVNALGLSFLGVPGSDNSKGQTFLLPFEIVSIHLLVVLIAAAYLARAKQKPVVS